MSVRLLALSACILLLLSGCVTSSIEPNPLDTPQGRKKAVESFVQLGTAYIQQGALERAKAPLQRALAIDSSSADANAALAMVFQKEQESAVAERYYQRALSESNNAARILNNYASFLYEQGRFTEAQKYFLKASEDLMYSGRSRVFENLGLTALALGQASEAKEYFERALRLDPTQAQSLIEAGRLAFDTKEYMQARDYYRRYLKTNSHSAKSLLLGIDLAEVFEDPETAQKDAAQLKRLYPTSFEYQQYLQEHKNK